MAYWLMKSEPDSFSIDDLAACKDGTEPWNGVRNYQARNFMRDDMRPGDGVLFYHSSCAEPGAVGLAEVASHAYADPSQFDPESPYFDPKSSADAPRWVLVDVRYRRHLPKPITLRELREHSDHLQGLPLLEKSQLSIMPVSEPHWRYLLHLAGL
jgi:predicted RNA-binding protein with PUA-like domain